MVAALGIATYTLLVRAAIMGGLAHFARQDLPSPETDEAIEGYNLLRTNRNGWIELTRDGEQMWVEAEMP